MKIAKGKQEVEIEEELAEVDAAELRSELPEQQPRFVLLAYRADHPDGRLSFPLYLLFFSPIVPSFPSSSISSPSLLIPLPSSAGLQPGAPDALRGEQE